MRVQKLSWKNHPTKQQIYGNIPSVSTSVGARRVQFAGHCCRAENEVISTLLLWKPSQSRGRSLSYPALISRDTGIMEKDLGKVMMAREVWRSLARQPDIPPTLIKNPILSKEYQSRVIRSGLLLKPLSTGPKSGRWKQSKQLIYRTVQGDSNGSRYQLILT